MAKNTPDDSRGLIPFPSSQALARRGLEDLSRAAKTGRNIIKVPEDCTELELALKQAPPGWTIDLAAGTYPVNLALDKPLTVEGRSAGATLLAGDPSRPVCRVACAEGELVLKGVSIRGDVGAQSIDGVDLQAGLLSVVDCDFSGIEEVLLEDESIRQGFAVRARGPGARLKITGSKFSDCWPTIDVLGGAHLSLARCVFLGQFAAVHLWDGSTASLRQNIFVGRSASAVGVMVGRGSKFTSDHDTYDGLDDVFSLSYDQGQSVGTVRHATIRCSSLVRIHYGTIQGAPLVPRLELVDCIVQMGSADVNARYSAFDSGVPTRRLGMRDVLKMEGKNLFFCPPDFPGPDPLLGGLSGNQLRLASGSPAIGSASDGTNLGAWQGPVE